MYITAEMLREKKACEYQVEKFESEWSSGVVVNAKSVKRAGELGLEINWFAEKFLSAPAWKAYEEATAPARKAYEEAKASALLMALGIEKNEENT